MPCLRVAFGATRAMEGAMPNGNLWNNSVPRVEHDHRAREARLQFEQLERLLVTRGVTTASRTFRLFRLLALSVSGTARRGGRSTGSPSDRRPCDMSAPPLTGSDKIRFAFADRLGIVSWPPTAGNFL
jgi:hypothetical protein